MRVVAKDRQGRQPDAVWVLDASKRVVARFKTGREGGKESKVPLPRGRYLIEVKAGALAVADDSRRYRHRSLVESLGHSGVKTKPAVNPDRSPESRL